MKSALGNYFIHIVFFCLELYFSGSHLIFSSKPNGLVYKVPPSVNFRKLSINVPLFGCVCVNGPKFIRRIEDRQGSSQYLQMLRELPSGGHYGFAQNHHPAHRSRLVKDWISFKSLDSLNNRAQWKEDYCKKLWWIVASYLAMLGWMVNFRRFCNSLA